MRSMSLGVVFLIRFGFPLGMMVTVAALGFPSVEQ